LTITYEPRAGDARALIISLGAGALIGLAIGGAYIVGGIAREEVSKPLLAQANRLQVPSAAPLSPSGASPGPVASVAPLAPSQPVSLRDRFSLALGLTRSVVQPFHFKAADPGADDHSRDTQCLAQAVYYEARGETSSGQAAVAQVVLNRVRHPAFPKTVCGVVFQHVGADCQFSFACNGAMRQPLDRAAWRRAVIVADRALSGAVMAEVGAATHFQAARSTSDWAGSLARVAQIGEHIFYRFTGRAGGARMFQAEPQRSGPDTEAHSDGQPDRVHAVFAVAAAAQAPALNPEANAAPATTTAPTVAKASPATAVATSASKVDDPAAKTPSSPAAAAAAGETVKTLKTADPEASKPIATTSTPS
jgi:hypothetical protein